MSALYKSRITQTTERAKERIKRVFREIKERLNDMTTLDSAFGLEFAYAGVPTGVVRKRIDSTPTHNILHFDVGPLPKKGTPARSVIEWEEDMDVLNPRDVTPEIKKFGKKFVTIAAAQLEVKRMLNSDGACHEYIAYEAAKLVAHEEVIKYTMHIMLGAEAEDYIFKPGETLKNLYIKPPKKAYKDHIDYARDIVPYTERETPSLIKGMFTVVAQLWRKLTGSVEEDVINRPYMAHFYDPTRDEDDRGLSVAGGEIKFQSALDRLKSYWDLGTNYYQVGKKGKAFTSLGHMVHLLSDMHVPAHVHNDIHGPTILLGKLDSLEQWAKKKDYVHLQRGENKMNITIWDSSPLDPPKPDQSWTSENVHQKLEEFVNAIVAKTQEFRSVDAYGTAPNQQFKGKLSDEECYIQAQILIPLAIKNCAQLISNFIDYQKRLELEAQKNAALL